MGRQLSELSSVKQFDKKGNKEGLGIAYSLSDLEESFRKFQVDYFPRLVNENLIESEREDILYEMGEEFRHILYHIKDMKYFDYLLSDSDK